MIETISILSLIALVFIFLYKVYNLMLRKNYIPFNVYGPTMLGTICFLFLFFGLSAQISYQKEIQDYSATNTLEATYKIVSNDYYSYSLYMNFAWIILILIWFFTIIESFIMLVSFTKNSRSRRMFRGYVK